MESLLQLLSGPLLYVAVFVPVTLGALALLFGVRSLTSAQSDAVKDRLDRTVQRGGPHVTAVPTRITQDEEVGALEAALSPFAKMATPGDEEELGRVRTKLVQAGFRSQRAIVILGASKVLLCLALGLGFIWFNSLRPQPLQNAAFLTVVLMMAGFYLPNFWVSQRATERRGVINRSLPDTIDLLVTCVEAGLGLDAAVARVSDEIMLSSPLLGQELQLAGLEMRAGIRRGEAFRRLAMRTGVDELRVLAAIIVQTEIFGASVAKSLRVQADALRIRRMQKAEEAAASVAVKMTIPLVLCVLPALMIVLMGPATVSIVRIMMPSMSGGR